MQDVGAAGGIPAILAELAKKPGILDLDAPMVSIVVATRGRMVELPECVDSLLAQQYPNFEIVVVDNNDNPADLIAVLADQLEDPRLRVVHEYRRGASVARNTGTLAARGELIAATDDDVIAARTWLPELVAAFDDQSVDCVTGLVLPTGFATPAQELFEEFGGFSKGFKSLRFDLVDNRAPETLYPYSPGIYGSGNNVAFRKKVLESVGGYDPMLGPGTLVKSGEDLDVFLKVLFAGKTLIYEPRARVSHSHRRTMDELHVQLRNYGRGLSAVILKWGLSDPRRLFEIILRLPAGLRRMLSGGSDRNSGRTDSYPASLGRAEILGYLEGAVLLPIQVLRVMGSRRPVTEIALSSIRSEEVDTYDTGADLHLH
jgi:glycosyltransferase involved in cell wall biosynthesis